MQLPMKINNKRGLSLVEILVASLIMAAIVVPLLDLFKSGIETTKATIKEIQGANLAAELSEQLDAIPFASLMKLCASGTTLFSSSDNTLIDRAPIDTEAGYYFNLSPLLKDFQRVIELEIINSEYIIVHTRVTWKVNKKRDRTILIKRCAANDGN